MPEHRATPWNQREAWSGMNDVHRENDIHDEVEAANDQASVAAAAADTTMHHGTGNVGHRVTRLYHQATAVTTLTATTTVSGGIVMPESHGSAGTTQVEAHVTTTTTVTEKTTVRGGIAASNSPTSTEAHQSTTDGTVQGVKRWRRVDRW